MDRRIGAKRVVLGPGCTRVAFARASITKHGGRVANVHVRAWQADEQQPIAAPHAHFLLKTEER